MRVVIHKYPLQIDAVTSIALPLGSKVLHFETQGLTPTIWVQEPLDVPLRQAEIRNFKVVGTGWVLDEPVDFWHIGTTQYSGYVWHCYELATA